MSETVRKLCKKAKLASRPSTDSLEDNLDLQEPAQKKIHLDPVKKNSDNDVSKDMDDDAMGEIVPEAAPSNYMSFLLSLSQDPQDEEPVEAFSPEALSSELEEHSSSSEYVLVPKEDKNYDVDIEKVKEILTVLHELYPDEMEAVIHTRNEWGKILYEKYPSKAELSAQDAQLQDVVAQWRRWSVKGERQRDTPFCYKCYICDKAWWSFEEFHTHTKQHACKYQMETTCRDFNIVAYQGHKARYKELQVDGKCFKCAKPYEYHVESKKLSDKYYSCLYCYKMFESCRAMSKHTGNCDSNPIIAESRKQLTFTDPPCEICGTFLTSSELSEHYTICHSVRSDEPADILMKTCHLCYVTFYVKEYHVCLKKIVNHCCSYCGCKYQNRHFLNSHLKVWKDAAHCKICNKYFEKACMLGTHYVEHSENFLMAYQCVMCDTVKLFETADELTEHRNIQHSKHGVELYEHQIVMAKVMLQQCIIGENHDFLKIGNNDNDDDDMIQDKGTISQDESDSLTPTQEQTIQEVQDCTPGSSSEDGNEESDALNVAHESVDIKQNEELPSQNTTILIKQEKNDANYSRQDDTDKIEVPVEHLDNGNKVKEEFEIDKDIEHMRENDDINIKTEKEENVTLINNEVPVDHLDNGNKVLVKGEVEIDEEEIELMRDDGDINIKTERDENVTLINNEVPDENVENSNKNVENENIADGACKNGTENNKVHPKLIEELNEFLDLKPDVAGVKDENISDDEGNLKIIETDAESNISTAHQSSAKEVTENLEHQKVFQVTKTLLESEAADLNKAKEEENDDLIVLDSSDSDDETLSSIKNSKEQTALNIEPEQILKAGYRKRKTYRCSKCNFSAFHKEYKEHLKSRCNTTKRPKMESNLNYKCTKCKVNFPSLRRYAVHFKNHGYEELVCPQCKSQFETANILESHINFHVKNQFLRIRMLTADQEEMKSRSYKCKDCEQIESRNDSFTHWESHLKLTGYKPSAQNNELAPFKVGGKGQHALKPGFLKDVIEKLQEEKLKLNTCFLCQRDFASPRCSDIKRHLIEHLLEDALANIVDNHMLKCQICDELNVKPELYKKHMRDHANLPIYQCSLCDKSFSDSSNFIKHKKVHNFEIFICDICNKKFQRMDSLETHMKQHSLTSPITCEYCNKEFQCPSLHRKHVRALHMKPLRARCYLCSETFRTQSLKAHHMWVVHKLRRNDADCPVCGKEFRTLSEVKRHARDEHALNFNLRAILNNMAKGAEKEGGEEKEGEEGESDDDCLVVEEGTETLIVLD